MPDAQAELLRKAVVSLERKLRDSNELAVKLQAEVARLQLEVHNLPTIRSRHAEASAERDALEQQAKQLRLESSRANAALEDERRKLERMQASLQAAEAVHKQEAEEVAQLKAAAEEMRLEGARMQRLVAVLEQQVQQLETANYELRQDSQAHAAALKAAYEREGELLAEVADLQAALRRQQPISSRGSADQQPRAEGPVVTHGQTPASRTLDQIQEGLFMAAAADLTQAFTNKLEKAEGKVGHLEQRLAAVSCVVDQLQCQESELRGELQAAVMQRDREKEVSQALLATNIRLHEMVVGLMQQEEASCMADAAMPAHSKYAATTASSSRLATPRVKQACKLQSAKRMPRQTVAEQRMQPAVVEPRLALAAGLDEKQAQARAEAAGEAQPDCPGSAASPAEPGSRSAEGAPPSFQPESSAHSSQQRVRRQPLTARQAAVQAALALASQHRELQCHQRQAAADLQQVASRLALAAPGKQLALLQQHFELQGKLKGISEQLEDRVLQLMALRRAELV